MADYNVHITKYTHNRKFSNALINTSDNYSDWQTIAIFYSALHIVEAILCRCFNEHTDNHKERHSFMLDHPNVFNHKSMKYYRLLNNLSHKARYTDVIMDNSDYYNAKEYFEKFEEEVKQYIN